MKTNYYPKPQTPTSHSAAPFGLQLPIQLSQEHGRNLWTWQYNGQQVRNHFVSGFWYTEDGENVFWAWQDLNTHCLTSLKPVAILTDSAGRLYVEVKRKGEEMWNQFLDEAVCTCFHAKPKNGQVVRHIDGNKANCSADNLEWCYPSDITA